jgi:ATP-dependent Clp protease ATP-binding subunit ClpC
LGFIQPGEKEEDRQDREKIDKALKSAFRPEFLNRIDEIILFSPLTLKDMDRIVDLQMKEVASRLEEQGLSVELSEEAREWLAKTGFDPMFGARPLKRVLQKYVESELSVKLLSGEYKTGDKVLVGLNEEKTNLTFKKDGTVPVKKVPSRTEKK